MADTILRHGYEAQVWTKMGGMRIERLLTDCGSFLCGVLFASSVSEETDEVDRVSLLSLESTCSDLSAEAERERLLLSVVIIVSGIDG